MNLQKENHSEPTVRDKAKVQALLKKADGHYRKGHRRRAAWSYEKALKQDPDNVTALVNLGLIFFTMKGKGKRALGLLQRALAVDPDNATILFNLATVTAHFGERSEALALLEQAERLKPDYPDLHYNKAYLFTQVEDWEAAEKEVERELKNNPQNFNARVMKEALQHRKSLEASESEPPPGEGSQ